MFFTMARVANRYAGSEAAGGLGGERDSYGGFAACVVFHRRQRNWQLSRLWVGQKFIYLYKNVQSVKYLHLQMLP